VQPQHDRATAIMSGDKDLPTKESNLFKQVVKCYETKQYKKGLKAADTVLKKFPNHGETLSMKVGQFIASLAPIAQRLLARTTGCRQLNALRRPRSWASCRGPRRVIRVAADPPGTRVVNSGCRGC
jgi:hypothetical protein